MPSDFRFGGMVGPMVEPIDGGGQRGRWMRDRQAGLPAPQLPMDLQTSVAQMGKERQSLMPYRDRALTNLANQGERMAANVQRVATMRAAQGDRAMPTSFRGALDAATRRARARQGIVNRGDAAVRNQQLKDRLAVANQQLQRRGDLQNTLQQALNIKEGVNVGVSDANNRAKASRYKMLGSLAGAATKVGMHMWNNRSMLTQSMDQGTAGADMLNQNPDFGVNYSDPYSDPTVYG